MTYPDPPSAQREALHPATRVTHALAQEPLAAMDDTINRDLADGSWGGIYAYVAAWCVIGAVTDLCVDFPKLFAGTLVSLTVLGAMRLRLIRRLRAGAVRDGAAWRKQLLAQLVVSGLVWSGATAYLGVMQLDSLAFRGATFGLLTMAGIGTATMSPSIRIATAYVASVMLPAVLTLLLSSNGDARGTGVGLGVVFAFVLYLVRRMSCSYHLQLKTSHELSEQKEDLLRAQAELHQAEHAREMFFAAVSHELRNPLNGIMGMAEQLGDSQLDKDQEELLSIIRASGDQMLGVIGDVLDLAKARQGELSLEAIPIDLAVVAHEVADMVGHGARAKSIEFKLDAKTREAQVMGDPLRIRQVLLNLTSNAIKFTESGGVTLALEPMPSDAGGPRWYRFSVRDTGVGMDASSLGKVFEPFQQGSASTQRQHGGTGLGLSIVTQLVDRMGGRIHAESEVGAGSCFTVELPFAAQASESETTGYPARTAEVSSEDAGVAAIEWSEIRVLIADDQDVNRRVLERMCKRIGVESVIVSDGAQAVAAFAETKFDLVLLDCQMPVMDGFEAARVMRASRADHAQAVPILALTGSDRDLVSDGVKDAGMGACLMKPIKQHELAEAMEEHLLRSGAEKTHSPYRLGSAA